MKQPWLVLSFLSPRCTKDYAAYVGRWLGYNVVSDVLVTRHVGLADILIFIINS